MSTNEESQVTIPATNADNTPDTKQAAKRKSRRMDHVFKAVSNQGLFFVVAL